MFSPGFRALTKITTRLPCRSWNVGRTWKEICAQPVASVVTSASCESRSNGTPRPWTIAPLTQTPLVVWTWNRATSGTERDEICDGEYVILSTTSRSGRLTLLIDWHWPAGGPLPVTTEVAFEIAADEPTLFDAVTRTRSVCPTSAAPSVYVCAVTGVPAQSPPLASQRRQRYESWIGLVPLQSPGLAVSV